MDQLDGPHQNEPCSRTGCSRVFSLGMRWDRTLTRWRVYGQERGRSSTSLSRSRIPRDCKMCHTVIRHTVSASCDPPSSNVQLRRGRNIRRTWRIRRGRTGLWVTVDHLKSLCECILLSSWVRCLLEQSTEYRIMHDPI